MIKMIGLDMDGTLLNDKKELSEYTRSVLVRALDQGIVVLPATGRPLVGVPKAVREIPGIRYALTANGARVVDMDTGAIIYEKLLSVEDSVKVLDILREYDTLREVFREGRGYIEESALASLEKYLFSEHAKRYVLETRAPIDDLEAYVKKIGEPLDKVHGIFSDYKERTEAFRRLRELKGIAATSALSNNIEVSHSAVNKGNGLVELGRALGIKQEEIMGCGDGMNDVEMIREAGLGIAMANGVAAVKECADYITGTNNEDGVAKAIEKFVLN